MMLGKGIGKRSIEHRLAKIPLIWAKQN